MATYGDFPGVKITTKGGGLTGVTVGAAEKLVIFGEGDNGNATATANTPTQIASLSDADTKFGSGSELAEAVKQALSNGANRGYLYAVMLNSPSQTTDTFSSASDHTGASKLDAPIKEDASAITVGKDTSGDESYDTDITVEFRYETNTDKTSSDFTSSPPENSDTVYVNPLTGEWVADASGDYEFSYESLDYQSALDSADTVLDEGDTGVYGVLSESPDVHSTLSAKVSSLRSNYQMVQAVAGARPNKTTGDDNAGFDAGNYSDNVDDDSVYLLAPARQKGETETIVGAVSGMMAGHPITDPIYNDAVSGLSNLEQKLTGAESDDLREEKVIPVRDAGSIRVKANISTSTQTDWTRDFWRRRIVDRVILITKMVGDDTVGRINDENSRGDAQNVIYSELSQMVNNRLLKPNTGEETRWYVEVVEDTNNSDQINIDIGITPQGIVKRIDETITINT